MLSKKKQELTNIKYMVDYSSLAKQQGGQIDYAAMAKKYGGSTQQDNQNQSMLPPINTESNNSTNPASTIAQNYRNASWWNLPAKLGELTTGAAKQVGQLGVNTLNLAKNIGQKITGIQTPDIQTPDALQYKSGVEQAGGLASSIAEFFLPGGQEKAATGALDAAIDSSKVINKLGKLAPLVKSALKAVGSGAVSGTSMAGVTAAQTGDLSQAETAGIVGSIAGTAGKLLEQFSPGIIKSLSRSNLKISPSIEAKAGMTKKIEGATSFISDNKILGTPQTQWEKLNNITGQFENAVQSSVKNDITVSKKDIIKVLKQSAEPFKTSDPAFYSEIKKDVNEAAGILAKTKGKEVGLNDLLTSKRSWGNRAFSKSAAAGKGADVTDKGALVVEKTFEDILNNIMSTAKRKIKLPAEIRQYFGVKTSVSLEDFNKVYSQAINAKKLTNLSRFKNDTGLMGRLFSLWVGSSIGETISPGLAGKIVGGGLGEIAATGLPTILRSEAARLSTVGGATVPLTKIGTGIVNNQSQNNQ